MSKGNIIKVIKPNILSTTDGTFTRSTTATYFNINKVLTTAAINEPRFEYDPSTAVFNGILIEAASTNLLTQSETLDNAAWTKTRSTIAVNNTTAPDGNITADKIVEDSTASATHEITRAYTFTATSHTFSGFVKASTRDKVLLQCSDGTSNFGAYFDLTNAVVISLVGTTTASIKSVGNNWYRVFITFTPLAGTGYTAIRLCDASGNSSYSGDNTSGLFVWGIQLETGGIATSYIPTVSSTVTRAADTTTGSGLIYSTVTDSTAAWASGTTYALNDKVRYASHIYQSLQASNTNHQPDTSITWWVDLGPDNIHAAFDTQISTVSSATTEMTFVVKPGVIDSIALMTIDAAIAEVAVTDPVVGTVYTNIAGLAGTNIYDWYQYFFYDPLVKRTQVIFYGILPYVNSLVTVRLKTSPGVATSIAQALFGVSESFGDTQYTPTAGIIDYSIKDTDAFGTTTFVKRGFSKRLSAEVMLPSFDVNRIQRFLYSIRATPVVWVASDDPTYEEALVVYGFYKDFSTAIAYPTYSLCSLEIEGLS